MTYKHFLVALTFSGVMLAQGTGTPALPVVPSFPPALRLFLNLSDTQIQMIRDLNVDYIRFVATKARRLNQVQQEITDETQKQVLDPMALGLRYVEIEAIRREVNDELTKLQAKVRDSLSDTQRQMLSTLEDAIKLLPIYSEAVQVHLVAPAETGVPRVVTGGFTFAPDPLSPPVTTAPTP
jgi:hypothetical protein